MQGKDVRDEGCIRVRMCSGYVQTCHHSLPVRIEELWASMSNTLFASKTPSSWRILATTPRMSFSNTFVRICKGTEPGLIGGVGGCIRGWRLRGCVKGWIRGCCKVR